MVSRTGSSYSRVSNSSSLQSPKTPRTSSSSEQKDVEVILTQIQEKVIQLAGGDKKYVNERLTADDVVRMLDSAKKAKEAKAEKYSTLQKTVSRTLQCIQVVGGFAASAASNVFAPSEMCFNALSFVITAWQGQEEMFDHLGELLERCSEFLERLDYFKNTMDTRLARLACQNLQLFVEVCDQAIKLTRKRNKWKAFGKRLFLDEDDIKVLLDAMERLDRKEMLLVNAQNYSLARDSSGLLKLMMADQKEAKQKDDAKKWRKAIAKALGFPDETLGADEEPIPYWQRSFDARKENLVPQTGVWIEDPGQIDFIDWAKSEAPRKSLLVLEGETGTGKTSMMANVLRSMRRSEQCGPTTRSVTAFFFRDSGTRKIQDIVKEISRILLWQICTAYEAMIKSVAQIAQKYHEFDDSLDMWQKLFIDNKERLNADTTFYIFIDGFDEDFGVLLPLVDKLTTILDTKRPRIFLTAVPGVVDPLDQNPDASPQIMTMADHNGDDIVKYIEHRMDDIPITKNPARRPHIKQWRVYILAKLRERCGTDYFKLNSSLDALAKVDLIEDVKNILDVAGRDRFDQVDTEIRQLNESRTPNEIKEINEIIMWIETGRQVFTVDEMEGLISVRYQGQSPRSTASPIMARGAAVPPEPSIPSMQALSLLPFPEKIRNKYPIFTITDSNRVNWRSVEYKRQVPVTTVAAPSPTALRAPDLHSNKAVLKAEVDIVRHFMHTVCPPGLVQRLDIDKYLDSKQDPGQSDFIRMDPVNSNIKIVIECLTILTGMETQDNSHLHHYAQKYLLDHMRSVDLQAVDPNLKAQSGLLLVQLFTEEEGIDALFWATDLNVSFRTWSTGEAEYLRRTRSEWLYSVEGVQEISKWLSDNSVTRHIRGAPGLSMVRDVRAPHADLHKAILGAAAKVMATHMFRLIGFTKQQFLSAGRFLRGYLSRIDEERSEDMPTGALDYRMANSNAFNFFEDEKFTVDQLREIEEWASPLLGRENDDTEEQSLWEIHAALAHFQLCGEDAQDIYTTRAKKALELDPKNWHACHFIASRDQDNEAAVKLLSDAKMALDKAQEDDNTWIQDHANTSLLARITLDLGNRLWDQGNYAKAAEKHLESLEYDYVHFKNYGRVLVKYRQRKTWDDVNRFMVELTRQVDSWAAFFDELVNDIAVTTIDEVLETLAIAAQETNRWDVVEGFFEAATNVGLDYGDYDLLFELRRAHALVLADGPDDNHMDRAIFIRQTALDEIRAHPSDRITREEIKSVENNLAATYFDRAFAPNTLPEKRDQWGKSLRDLAPQMSSSASISSDYIIICYLIRYYHKIGSDKKLSQSWIHVIFRQCIELLSDEDDENDAWGYWLLSCLLTTCSDQYNSRITWTLNNIRNMDQQKEWEEFRERTESPSDMSSDSGLQPGTPPSDEDATTPIAAQNSVVPQGLGITSDNSTENSFSKRPSISSSISSNTPPSLVSSSTPTTSSEASTPIAGGNGGAISRGSTPRANAFAWNTKMRPPPSRTDSSSSSGSTRSNSNNHRPSTSSPPLKLHTFVENPIYPRTRSLPPSANVDPTFLNRSTGIQPAEPYHGEPQQGPRPVSEPVPLIDCDGCGQRWTVIDSRMFTCADCVGQVQLCEQCYELLRRGELKKPSRKELKCLRGDHEFFEIPKYEAWFVEGAPTTDAVPLPDGGKEGRGVHGKTDTFIPWKRYVEDLKILYLGKDGWGSSVLATPISSQVDSINS